jgi:archaellum component FlaF (FlaF/FlaG flagellin family)
MGKIELIDNIVYLPTAEHEISNNLHINNSTKRRVRALKEALQEIDISQSSFKITVTLAGEITLRVSNTEHFINGTYPDYIEPEISKKIQHLLNRFFPKS